MKQTTKIQGGIMENENKAQEIFDEIVENLEKESNEDFVDILTEVISKLNDQVEAMEAN